MFKRPALPLLAAACCLPGCHASPPPRPDSERHRCVTSPNGMVEGSLRDPAGERSRPG